MSAIIPPYRKPSGPELLLIRELRSEADADFGAQFEQDRFLDWSRLARRASWRTNLALVLEAHGAGWTLGWIGAKAAESEDRAFWEEAIARVRAAL